MLFREQFAAFFLYDSVVAVHVLVSEIKDGCNHRDCSRPNYGLCGLITTNMLNIIINASLNANLRKFTFAEGRKMICHVKNSVLVWETLIILMLLNVVEREVKEVCDYCTVISF